MIQARPDVAQEAVIARAGSNAVSVAAEFVILSQLALRGYYANMTSATPKASTSSTPGYTQAEAALTAKRADVVIAFGLR